MRMPETTPAPDMSLRDLAQFAEGEARRLAANFGLDPSARGGHVSFALAQTVKLGVPRPQRPRRRAANRQPAPLRQHRPPAFREGGRILLSGRIFALIRQLSFARIKGFVITRQPAGSGGRYGT
jgi:hypothetical protein